MTALVRLILSLWTGVGNADGQDARSETSAITAGYGLLRHGIVEPSRWGACAANDDCLGCTGVIQAT
jgi:hypothetical protein